ncbi:MAG: HAMP domain-containing histidine kinase [Helicobacter sp.]|nr:HAMP domain-containing histidine kinase [Helicobacter sp.]
MNPRQSAVLKILLLYLLSTALLLAIALPIIYSFQTQALFEEERERLYNARGAIFFALHAHAKKEGDIALLHENLQSISQTFNLPFALFIGNALLFSNIAHLDIAAHNPKDFENLGRITLINGRAYLFDSWRKKLKRADSTFMILEGSDLSEEFFGLKMRYLLLSALALAGIGIVALFLVRLALRPLQNQIQALNDFLKDSTHEINTPLSVIMMSIERFNQEELSPKNKKLLHNILIASRTMTHLYDDLIYLNFPSAIPDNAIEFDLAQLIRERVDYFAPHIAQKQLQLTTQLQPMRWRANLHKIAKLLDNVLSNAIKYNQPHGILSLQLCDRTFSICNNGAIDTKAHIFERYTRANKDQGGFGIGLAIVQQICTEYHITISVESNESTTTFRLAFPT